MARTKKAKTTTKRKSTKVSGTKAKCTVPKTRKFGEKSFKDAGRNYTKTDAKKAAERHRKGGSSKLARVVPNPCGSGFRVYKRG